MCAVWRLIKYIYITIQPVIAHVHSYTYGHACCYQLHESRWNRRRRRETDVQRLFKKIDTVLPLVVTRCERIECRTWRLIVQDVGHTRTGHRSRNSKKNRRKYIAYDVIEALRERVGLLWTSNGIADVLHPNPTQRPDLLIPHARLACAMVRRLIR